MFLVKICAYLVYVETFLLQSHSRLYMLYFLHLLETTPAPADATDVPLLPPEDSNTTDNKHNIYKLFDGLIWTALTCTAGGLGYYVINGHMNNDGVATVIGAVCGVTTGALLAVYLNKD